MTKIAITGAKGRMGQALINCAAKFPELQIAAQIDKGDDLASVIEKCDVVIDFSFHDTTAGFAEICAAHKRALVIGTTGHTEADKSAIANRQSAIPMVWASNYSTGVNTLFWLTRKAAEILGPAFDLEVIEMHHRMKVDAPSGTARSLARTPPPQAVGAARTRGAQRASPRAAILGLAPRAGLAGPQRRHAPQRPRPQRRGEEGLEHQGPRAAPRGCAQGGAHPQVARTVADESTATSRHALLPRS